MFQNTVKCAPISSASSEVYVISSHVLYKVKLFEDISLQMKSRVAPHGNQDRDFDNLKTDSSSILSTSIRIFLSVSVMFEW